MDQAWWSFFSDYRSSGGNGDDAPEADSNGSATTAPPVANRTSGSASATAPAEAGHTNGAAAPQAPAPPAAPRPAAPPAPSAAAPSPATPATPASPAPAPAKPAAPPAGGQRNRLRGAAARTAVNMVGSLAVPTATSVRDIPAKLLIDNRIVINNHLKRGRGGKVSFTHLIGYAVIRALAVIPAMNDSFAEVDGKPVLVQPEHVNLGLAIDVAKDDGSRQLLVPNIKGAEVMDFRQFWTAYEDVVRKARTGKLTVEDFAGTTISLTNPGTIGTEHSIPRLMAGQGTIVGVGAMEYPAAYQGASDETLVPAGRQPPGHADLDLRPPDHPGRAVR